jgi:hypothetical protein
MGNVITKLMEMMGSSQSGSKNTSVEVDIACECCTRGDVCQKPKVDDEDTE